MIYIIDTTPNFCPGCGNDVRSGWKNKYNRQDFYAHAAHSCNTCGAKFQYVSEDLIVRQAQEAGGDMVQS